LGVIYHTLKNNWSSRTSLTSYWPPETRLKPQHE
jgi:hypothetical protein